MPRSVIRVNDGVLPWALVTQVGAKGDTGSGGGGAVSSVNGQTGAVTLTAASVAETSTKKIMTDTERTKLSGIATGATANSSDATLLDLGNATGTLGVARLPSSVPLFVAYAGGTPVRPTTDNTRVVIWMCSTSTRPAEVTSGTGGSYPIDLVVAPV